MLIVSQDNEKIINFSRISEIVVSNNEICITDDIFNEFGEEIGVYATKERAKQVSEEIITAYSDFEFYKYVDEQGKDTVGTAIMQRYQGFDIYRMPKE